MLKNIVDHHVHSDFSSDCDSKMEDVIDVAKKLGLKGVMFTDHVDFDSPDPLFTDLIDYDEYINKINELRSKNKDLDILLGVEIGYQPHLHKRIDEFLASYPFDFVICSMHTCCNLDLYNEDFFKNKTQKNSYEIYFNEVLKSVETYKNFDVYGHLDYIIRYGSFENKEMKYIDYKEAIDLILKRIVDIGKGIELNTSGMRYGLNVFHPNVDILRRYKELGGEIITLGSDSHRPNDLQANFNEAIDMLRELGYKAITEFKERKPKFIDIV